MNEHVAHEAEPEQWAIVELMGHRQRAGVITEVDRYGVKLLQVDIPIFDTDGDEAGTFTEQYGGAAIYAIRPCTADVARAWCKSNGDPRPVNPINFRPAAQLSRFIDDEED